MTKGIRPYGHGKFHTLIDSYAYGMTLDGGADEEESYPDGGGWYGLLYIDDSTAKRIAEQISDEDGPLTQEESDLINDSVAVILYERGDGIVDAEWFDDEQKLEDAWAEIQEQFESEEEEGDE